MKFSRNHSECIVLRRIILITLIGFAFCFAQTKSPRRAMIYSAILPGAGQFYNEQKIKSALVFSANSWAVWNVYEKQKAFKLDNSTENLEARNGSVWLLALFYGMNVLDAYVDAHLYESGKRKPKKINDKAQHFLTNFASTMTVNYYSFANQKTSFVPAISLNSAASIGKEIWDLNGHGNFELADLVADFLGIGAGIWITERIVNAR